jgi:transposase InsO family protein
LVGSFQCETKVSESNSGIQAEFVVIDGQGQPLLGRDTAMSLGVLQVGINLVKEDIREEFPECFRGVGKLTGYQVKLHVDNKVKPVIQPLRRPPFSLRSKIEAKLDELESLGIIEEVDSPSPWVNPLVVVPKSDGEVRLCVDMRQANPAVLRERYPIPTIEEVLQELNKSKVFTKLDLKWGYHQLELEEGSRGITTFITHKGLYRYRRLMFGISSAPEKYQQVIQQVLQGIDGVKNISDDIVVYGETQAEHDRRVRQVMERLRDKGLTLNYEKCCFSMSELTFMGHVLSGRGVSIAENKVKAVKEARAPNTPTEVRSFLGLVNYSCRFIPNLATKSEPLRRLTKKDEPFLWGKEQEEAFRELKAQLGDAKTLGYFDRHAETYVISDASPVGLGAVLVQKQGGENQVIAYASRSLTDVETRYSQTEKEALGLVWACEHFHMYLLGTKFVLVTDHKPLEVLYSPRSKPSARIERWVLRLQSYDYVVQYQPGKTNIADPLSRLSCKSAGVNSQNVAEEYVRFVAQEAVPKAMTARQVEECSHHDPELARIRECIRSEDWENSKLSKYYPVRDELCIVGKLVLRGTRLVIPQELRGKVMSIAHEGHVGMSATKLRLRTKVWWPEIDKDVVKYIESCHGCQLVGKANPPEPICPTELPPGKWQDLAMDFLGPMPTGEYLFVVIDYYTRYYEVEITTSVTAKRTVEMLCKMFAVHGLPFSITSDNGPQFISRELQVFFEEHGIRHRRVTPRWAQANGEVERQNRSMLKSMKIAQSQGKNWRSELLIYLGAYRSTPHSTTGVAPAELLFGRKIRTKLPELQRYEVNDEEVRDRDLYKKVKSSGQMDVKRRAEKCDLELGDQVLVKADKQDKLSTNFKPVPYEVVQRNGNMVVIESPQKVRYKRNITEVKRFTPRMEGEREVQVEEENKGIHEDSVMLQDDKQSDNAESPPPGIEVQSTPRPQRERKAPPYLDDYVRLVQRVY